MRMFEQIWSNHGASIKYENYSHMSSSEQLSFNLLDFAILYIKFSLIYLTIKFFQINFPISTGVSTWYPVSMAIATKTN